jgi:hypothetical protein
MSVILWTILALVLVALVVLATGYQARSVPPPLVLPAGETLPTAPLQRLVRWCLALGLIPLVIAAGLVAWRGPATYSDDDIVRLTVTTLLVAGMLLLVAPTLFAGTWASRGDARLDERDRAILARAPAHQAAAMLVVLAVWMIALQETYRDSSGIPEVFLYLIFWSCLLVSQLASNVSILVGYRRS